MKACLNFDDILGLGQPQVQEMQRIGDAYEDPDVPGACEAFTRQVRIVGGILVQTYEPTGPFGAKAVAEIPINGPAPAIANAIYNAIGIRIRDLPFTPEKIWKHLAAKNGI